MKKRHDSDLINDILHAANLARSFVDGFSIDQFEADPRTHFATIHQLMVIGEAANRLSTTFRKALPSVPWKKMIGMRNVLIHIYEEADLTEVWKTVQEDLPALVTILESEGRALLTVKNPK